MSKWISVDDIYPPSDKRVIAFTDNDDLAVRYRFIPAGLFKQVASEATHWMYIPDDPEV
jgi:hypothetical protein